MINFKNNWKYVPYYSARYLLWLCLWISVISSVTTFILLAFSYQDYISIVNALDRTPVIIDRVFFLLIGFVIHKQILRKVFFKKYKKFELIPHFNKITWKFNFQVYLITWSLGFLTNYLFELLSTLLFKISFKNSDDLDIFYSNLQIISNNMIAFFVLISIFIVVSIFVNIMVLKYFVEKYATITEKIETEIKH